MIEKHKGKLARHDRKRCDEYAHDILGHRQYAPWLYVYTALSGQFKEGWIPDNYYGAVVLPTINGHYGKISSLKPLNACIFNSPLFPDKLSYVNGMFFDTHYNVIPEDRVKETLFQNTDKVIFKMDKSSKGKGIHIFTEDDFTTTAIKKSGNGLIQSYIYQHDVFNHFTPNAVATLRITTFMENNADISIRGCFLRLGIGKDTHVQTRSIEIPIDPETGSFHKHGITHEWKETPIHPVSQSAFAGHTIPCFEQCIEAVKQLHKKAPFVRCIGWDLTVDQKDQVKVMEWNAGHNGIKFSEATQGPGFADLGWEKIPHK
ncbi:MAG: hypothetical protein EA349_16725 [Halomonadaceae bacterium]|nr:MAG: hypothetical protein EA349_16725 [Halomonadaceae bacterium]